MLASRQTQIFHDIEGYGYVQTLLGLAEAESFILADRNDLKQSRKTGIEEAAAYLSDGRRLRTDNVSTLAKVHDQVSSSFSGPLIARSSRFNKYYLDRDPDDVAKLLHLQPPQPHTERLYSPLSHRSITRPPRAPLSLAPRSTAQHRRIAIDQPYRGVHAAPALHAATCERHRLSRAQGLGRRDGRASDVCLAELRKLRPLLMVISIFCSYPIIDSLICIYPALIVNVEPILQEGCALDSV